ncbi:isochorismatase family protein [Hamadaea sp. NPDC051192]|uniref:isochorismatase family protein n=1 Tax=Hamadaea sp. NPDC051192 TaxID=3154940 RepID=UPI00343C219A
MITESYPMPAAMPDNVPGWQPDPRRAALLVHDLQNYFVGLLPDPGGLLANAATLVTAARRAGLPVFYTAQPGRMTPADRGLLLDFWGPGMPPDPAARAIADAVAPSAGDTVLTKWRYSAYHRSDFHAQLAGRDQLILCGVYAHVGIQMTAADAYCRDVEVFVAGDAVADFTERHHRQALEWMAATCAVVSTTADLSAALAP